MAHAQALIGSSLYIYGGRQGVNVGDGDLNDMHKLDLSTGEWSAIAPGNEGPSARSFHQMCAAGGKLHVFGGCPGHDRASDLWTFDPETLMWQIRPEGGMRGRGGAGFIADLDEANLYVIAGFAGEETNDCYSFNLASESWSTIPSESLRPRSVFGLCALLDKIVIFGGEVDPSAHGHSGAGDFANDVVVLDTNEKTFVNHGCEGAPLGRGWTRIAANSHQSFILFGGLAGNDEAPLRLDDLWQCDLS